MAHGRRNINCSYFCWIPEVSRTASSEKFRSLLAKVGFVLVILLVYLHWKSKTQTLELKGIKRKILCTLLTWKSWIWTISDWSNFEILKHYSYILHTVLKGQVLGDILGLFIFLLKPDSKAQGNSYQSLEGC